MKNAMLAKYIKKLQTFKSSSAYIRLNQLHESLLINKPEEPCGQLLSADLHRIIHLIYINKLSRCHVLFE